MAEFKGKNYLEEVKSSHILKAIFYFINEKQKLNLIIYNKKFQKLFGVDIKNYKILSGKYSTVKKNGNGKGRVYILKTKRLIFEGEFLNGKKNGKGKEFNEDGNLEFEGEYLNGERNGQGKEYNNGKLKYEGKYSNGKSNRKEYNKNNELIFEGEYYNGERWSGYGKEYNKNDQLMFEGHYFN